jgi:hypothetical protein
MKFSSSIATLFLSTLVAAEGLSLFGGGQKILDGSLSVPGESPLEYCQPGHDDDLLTIEHVNLTPNPPTA